MLGKCEFNSTEINCKLCGKIEDSFHVMFECPHYAYYRIKFLNSLTCVKPDRNNFIQKFQECDVDKIKNIYHFWLGAAKIRQVYINEIDAIN